MSINYSDGPSVENRILSFLKDAACLGSESCIAEKHYGEWPVRYHLSPERANLLRHFDFSGLEVLELGAGMGAISRLLSERCEHLTVVEGTALRFRALSERLRDRRNWDGVVSNIEDFETSKRFDVVCVIGVMEYAELYFSKSDDPHVSFLKKATSFLKPGGVLILAIENALGLKYWAGKPEDHTGRFFDGVCGYPSNPTARTFSLRSLKEKLREIGHPVRDLYLPFPDYKVPKHWSPRSWPSGFPPLAQSSQCRPLQKVTACRDCRSFPNG